MWYLCAVLVAVWQRTRTVPIAFLFRTLFGNTGLIRLRFRGRQETSHLRVDIAKRIMWEMVIAVSKNICQKYNGQISLNAKVAIET